MLEIRNPESTLRKHGPREAEICSVMIPSLRAMAYGTFLGCAKWALKSYRGMHSKNESCFGAYSYRSRAEYPAVWRGRHLGMMHLKIVVEAMRSLQRLGFKRDGARIHVVITCACNSSNSQVIESTLQLLQVYPAQQQSLHQQRAPAYNGIENPHP